VSGLGSARVMAFVATREPEAARAFYHEALGLRLIADEQSALVFDANGTQLRIQKVRDHTPFPYTVLGWAVRDIQDALADLSAKGVSFERYEWLPADATGVWTAPDGTKVAWFKDPDGNLLSLTEFGAGKPRPPLRRVR
jgi:catechol 2,3-dioxygenase-like lactoylglutathione lyase family enzyme